MSYLNARADQQQHQRQQYHQQQQQPLHTPAIGWNGNPIKEDYSNHTTTMPLIHAGALAGYSIQQGGYLATAPVAGIGHNPATAALLPQQQQQLQQQLQYGYHHPQQYQQQQQQQQQQFHYDQQTPLEVSNQHSHQQQQQEYIVSGTTPSGPSSSLPASSDNVSLSGHLDLDFFDPEVSIALYILFL